MVAGLLTGGAFGYLFDYVIWCALYLSLILHTWCFFRFFPRDRRRKTGLVLGNALVFLVLLGGVALAAESYLRFVAVYTDSFGVSLPARRWFALHTRLNSLGCRDREWTTSKPDGVRRIAFVGDSFTYGWGIERVEDRFTDLIQARFDSASPGTIEVLNVSKPGWGTGDQIQPIRDIIELFGIDEIVLCYVPNDIEKLIPTSEEFNPTRPPDYGFFNLDASPLLDYVYRRVYLPTVPTVRSYHDWLADGFANDTVWSAHVGQFRDIGAECRERGVAFRAAVLPFLRTGGKKFRAELVHQRVGAALRDAGADVVDLLPVPAGAEPGTLIVNSLDAHPNEAAQRMIADAIWKAFYVEKQ